MQQNAFQARSNMDHHYDFAELTELPDAMSLGSLDRTATLSTSDIFGKPSTAPDIDPTGDFFGTACELLAPGPADHMGLSGPASAAMLSNPQPIPPASKYAQHPGCKGSPTSWDSDLSSCALQESLNTPEIPYTRTQTLLKRHKAVATRGDGASEVSSPSHSLGCDAAQEKLSHKATLADRNRERQQRFRQRQKTKITDLEAQVAQLTTSCKHLTAEKEEAANRSSQLQELLNARDRQLVKASTHLCQLRAATSCKFGEAGTSTTGPTESAPQLGLTVRSEPIVLSTKQLYKMTSREVGLLWKEYVWQLSLILPNPADGIAKVALTAGTFKRLDVLTSELLELTMHLWTICPDFTRLQVLGRIQDDAVAPQEEGTDRWRKIVELMGFTEEQSQSTVALHLCLRQKLAALHVQRRDVHTNLVECLEENFISSREAAAQQLKATENSDTLREGLKQENTLLRDFEYAFFKKIMSPVQRALCLVHCYPWLPDCQAMATWAGALVGNPECSSRLQSSTSTQTTSFTSHARA